MNSDTTNIKIPLVSVVLCTYNRIVTFTKALDSILEQNVKFPYEIIIGDDYSVDGTRDLCFKYQQKYPDLIKLVFQNENGGIGRNWASAVKQAKGKYLAFCDDDDYWHNADKLQCQVDYLEVNLNCGAVHTEIDVFDESTSKVVKNYYFTNKFKIQEGRIFKEIFQGNSKICMSSFFVRRHIIDEFLPIDDYINLKFPLQDWPTWIIVAKHSNINYLPISSTTYRIGNLGITKMLNIEKAEIRFEKEHKMYKYICDKFCDDFKYRENDYLSYSYFVLLNMAYKKGSFCKALFYSKKLHDIGFSNFKSKMAQFSVTFYFLRFVLILKIYKTKF